MTKLFTPYISLALKNAHKDSQVSELTELQVLARISELREQIPLYDAQYYGDNASTISDFEYDELKRELLHYEKTYPEFVLKHFGELMAETRVGSEFNDNQATSDSEHLTEQRIKTKLYELNHEQTIIVDDKDASELSETEEQDHNSNQDSTSGTHNQNTSHNLESISNLEQNSVSSSSSKLDQSVDHKSSTSQQPTSHSTASSRKEKLRQAQLIYQDSPYFDLVREKSKYLPSQVETRFNGITLEQVDDLYQAYQPQEVVHAKQMLSLANVYDQEEFNEFMASCYRELATYKNDEQIQDLVKHKSLSFCAEPKLDGIAVSIIYENGKLARASTRGNGSKGYNITKQISRITNVPKELPEFIDLFTQEHKESTLEVRGEVIMPQTEFDFINKMYTACDKKPLVNLRNGAGSFVSRDPFYRVLYKLNNQTDENGQQLYDLVVVDNLPKKLPLKVFIYSVNQYQVDGIDLIKTGKHSSALDYVKTLGFTVSETIKVVSNVKDINNFYTNMQAKRPSLGFDIDGTVFKVDDFELQEKIGWIANSPKWAIAFKFPPTEANTHIKNIVNSIGRTGLVGPVAKIEPCFVGGVTISSISMYNYYQFKRMDLHTDDTIVIYRGGEVIPVIKTALVERRKSQAQRIPLMPLDPSSGDFLQTDVKIVETREQVQNYTNFNEKYFTTEFIQKYRVYPLGFVKTTAKANLQAISKSQNSNPKTTKSSISVKDSLSFTDLQAQQTELEFKHLQALEQHLAKGQLVLADNYHITNDDQALITNLLEAYQEFIAKQQASKTTLTKDPLLNVGYDEYLLFERTGLLINPEYSHILNLKQKLYLDALCNVTSASKTTINTDNKGSVLSYQTSLENRSLLLNQLAYFFSKDGIEIKGLGTNILDPFVSLGLCKNPANVYKIREPKFLEYASNLVKSLILYKPSLELAYKLQMLQVNYLQQNFSHTILQGLEQLTTNSDELYKLHLYQTKHQGLQNLLEHTPTFSYFFQNLDYLTLVDDLETCLADFQQGMQQPAFTVNTKVGSDNNKDTSDDTSDNSNRNFNNDTNNDSNYNTNSDTNNNTQKSKFLTNANYFDQQLHPIVAIDLSHQKFFSLSLLDTISQSDLYQTGLVYSHGAYDCKQYLEVLQNRYTLEDNQSNSALVKGITQYQVNLSQSLLLQDTLLLTTELNRRNNHELATAYSVNHTYNRIYSFISAIFNQEDITKAIKTLNNQEQPELKEQLNLTEINSILAELDLSETEIKQQLVSHNQETNAELTCQEVLNQVFVPKLQQLTQVVQQVSQQGINQTQAYQTLVSQQVISALDFQNYWQNFAQVINPALADLYNPKTNSFTSNLDAKVTNIAKELILTASNLEQDYQQNLQKIQEVLATNNSNNSSISSSNDNLTSQSFSLGLTSFTTTKVAVADSLKKSALNLAISYVDSDNKKDQLISMHGLMLKPIQLAYHLASCKQAWTQVHTIKQIFNAQVFAQLTVEDLNLSFNTIGRNPAQKLISELLAYYQELVTKVKALVNFTSTYLTFNNLENSLESKSKEDTENNKNNQIISLIANLDLANPCLELTDFSYVLASFYQNLSINYQLENLITNETTGLCLGIEIPEPLAGNIPAKLATNNYLESEVNVNSAYVIKPNLKLHTNSDYAFNHKPVNDVTALVNTQVNLVDHLLGVYAFCQIDYTSLVELWRAVLETSYYQDYIVQIHNLETKAKGFNVSYDALSVNKKVDNLTTLRSDILNQKLSEAQANVYQADTNFLRSVYPTDKLVEFEVHKVTELAYELAPLIKLITKNPITNKLASSNNQLENNSIKANDSIEANNTTNTNTENDSNNKLVSNSSNALDLFADLQVDQNQDQTDYQDQKDQKDQQNNEQDQSQVLNNLATNDNQGLNEQSLLEKFAVNSLTEDTDSDSLLAVARVLNLGNNLNHLGLTNIYPDLLENIEDHSFIASYTKIKLTDFILKSVAELRPDAGTVETFFSDFEQVQADFSVAKANYEQHDINLAGSLEFEQLENGVDTENREVKDIAEHPESELDSDAVQTDDIPVDKLAHNQSQNSSSSVVKQQVNPELDLFADFDFGVEKNDSSNNNTVTNTTENIHAQNYESLPENLPASDNLDEFNDQLTLQEFYHKYPFTSLVNNYIELVNSITQAQVITVDKSTHASLGSAYATLDLKLDTKDQIFAFPSLPALEYLDRYLQVINPITRLKSSYIERLSSRLNKELTQQVLATTENAKKLTNSSVIYLDVSNLANIISKTQTNYSFNFAYDKAFTQNNFQKTLEFGYGNNLTSIENFLNVGPFSINELFDNSSNDNFEHLISNYKQVIKDLPIEDLNQINADFNLIKLSYHVRTTLLRSLADFITVATEHPQFFVMYASRYAIYLNMIFIDRFIRIQELKSYLVNFQTKLKSKSLHTLVNKKAIKDWLKAQQPMEISLEQINQQLAKLNNQIQALAQISFVDQVNEQGKDQYQNQDKNSGQLTAVQTLITSLQQQVTDLKLNMIDYYCPNQSDLDQNTTIDKVTYKNFSRHLFDGKVYANITKELNNKAKIDLVDLYKSLGIENLGSVIASELAVPELYPNIESILNFDPNRIIKWYFDKSKTVVKLTSEQKQNYLEIFGKDYQELDFSSGKASTKANSDLTNNIDTNQDLDANEQETTNDTETTSSASGVGVGIIIVKSIIDYFLNPVNHKFLVDLIHQQNIKVVSQEAQYQNIFSNNTKVCITGSLPNLTRNEFSQFIKDSGGKYSSTITKDTEYLVVCQDFGADGTGLTSKALKAQQNGTKILSAQDFLKIYEESIKQG